MAEGVGNAPTSARADPVFETGAASLYLPAFRKWLPGLDSHQHRTAYQAAVLLPNPLSIQLIGLPGRPPPRIFPIKSRVPHVFGHGSSLNGRQADLSAEPSE